MFKDTSTVPLLASTPNTSNWTLKTLVEYLWFPVLTRSGLKEADAWPAAPQDAYGLEKLATEELCKYYHKDFGIEFRIGRFHNIYGPQGTWKGGREKAPAAFCRKARCSTPETGFEMWGDGLQTRSFCYIDDCVEGMPFPFTFLILQVF